MPGLGKTGERCLVQGVVIWRRSVWFVSYLPVFCWDTSYFDPLTPVRFVLDVYVLSLCTHGKLANRLLCVINQSIPNVIGCKWDVTAILSHLSSPSFFLFLSLKNKKQNKKDLPPHPHPSFAAIIFLSPVIHQAIMRFHVNPDTISQDYAPP